MKLNDISAVWNQVIGNPEKVVREQRAFNTVVVISSFILLTSFPINLYLGMYTIVWAVIPLLFWLILVYYMSRVRNRYRLSMIFYGLLSYVMVSILFFYNSGVNGPALAFSFLTFLLLLAFADESKQVFWLIGQLIFTVALIYYAYHHSDKAPFIYHNRADHYFDLAASASTIILSIYLIITYLRRSYFKEKKIAEERATLIAQQNEELIKLNAEKNKLFSILAHDLRSPLNSITSVLTLLTNYPLSDEQRNKLKKELIDNTRNTSEMLLNLLSWSTDQMKGMQPKPQILSLKDLTNKVLQIQQLIAHSKDITIEEQIKPDITVFADLNMLELILRNLINNAIKFTESGGKVKIYAQQQDQDCIVCVEDNGIGMSQVQIDNLFTFDIHSTYGTNNEKGIGLGLMLCKDFTQMQNGALWVNSRQNQGSIFYLRLPSNA